MAFDSDIKWLEKYTGPLMWGFAGYLAPGILKGILLEYLNGVTVQELSGWVEQNVSLWGRVDQESQIKLKKVRGKLGSIEWLTADWAIEAVRKEYPALASLFLGWPEAKVWLESQAQTIKKNLT